MSEHIISGKEIISIIEDLSVPYTVDPGFSSLCFSNINEYPERIRENGLFIFRKDECSEKAAEKAVLGGASGMITDHTGIVPGVPRLYTPVVYEVSTAVSRTFYNESASKLDQICILGTKGKTTTARMLHSILSCAMDPPVSYTTTNRSFDGLKTIRFPGTVSDPTVWYPLCERSIKNGCRVMVSEMPSYAEYFSRLTGIDFLYGIFTNLDRDHVSPFGHPTYESYVESKKKLAARCKNILANRDDRHYEEFLDAAANAYSKMTYSLNDENADFYVQDICKLNRGYSFTMITPSWEQRMSIQMSGIFNVSNALAAGALAYMMGIGPEGIAEGLGSIEVEGRMEMYEHNGFLAFVDYAHNGLSFREVFKSLKQDYPCRKIIVVTGIGGQVSEYTHADNADAIAANAAHSIITTDNPYSDNPAELCCNFRNLILDRGGSAEIIIDRKEAIKSAVSRLKADEVLLVAGMGDDRIIHYYNHMDPYEGDDVLTKKYIEEK